MTDWLMTRKRALDLFTDLKTGVQKRGGKGKQARSIPGAPGEDV